MPLSSLKTSLLTALGIWLASVLTGCASAPASATLAQGIIWQVDADHVRPAGDWDKLGVSNLLVQWTAVDNTAYVSDAGLPTAKRLPDWEALSRAPWANRVIVGLAGNFDEKHAREHVPQLGEQSLQLAASHPPVRIDGWFFPVEVDPTWKDAPTIVRWLNALPRPLWISVYDNTNIGGKALAEWLDSWLPHDVGIFWQDGCGVYARNAAAAREYADALSSRLGKGRVRIVAEAFRPRQGGGFRPTTAQELLPQLNAYGGYSVYLFDGPHYVSSDLVKTLLGSIEKGNTAHSAEAK